ncbi:hypothetical protein G6O69_27770 [Pseudenhygromyxa sp. WMMC2535]|uniref:hypothetical protein n=1 Tax=Pseudenhygromyxa sp. WMMC2535 TaxID=2712867 RepID=UPI0015519651|nr:hypothetical protein [Pseudenhygromyxa sp. WMMC2535]NVB41668.1 hypothetical protein [Pseudenhygromyxa sp. WMMC2535]
MLQKIDTLLSPLALSSALLLGCADTDTEADTNADTDAADDTGSDADTDTTGGDEGQQEDAGTTDEAETSADTSTDTSADGETTEGAASCEDLEVNTLRFAQLQPELPELDLCLHHEGCVEGPLLADAGLPGLSYGDITYLDVAVDAATTIEWIAAGSECGSPVDGVEPLTADLSGDPKVAMLSAAAANQTLVFSTLAEAFNDFTFSVFIHAGDAGAVTVGWGDGECDSLWAYYEPIEPGTMGVTEDGYEYFSYHYAGVVSAGLCEDGVKILDGSIDAAAGEVETFFFYGDGSEDYPYVIKQCHDTDGQSCELIEFG